MKVRVLGCSGGIGARARTTSFLVDSDILMDAGGHAAFYDAQGNSLRRAFLRAPVQFRRISSSFARARHHPILGITRRHEGTDYAASSGTPVALAPARRRNSPMMRFLACWLRRRACCSA